MGCPTNPTKKATPQAATPPCVTHTLRMLTFIRPSVPPELGSGTGFGGSSTEIRIGTRDVTSQALLQSMTSSEIFRRTRCPTMSGTILAESTDSLERAKVGACAQAESNVMPTPGTRRGIGLAPLSRGPTL